MPNWVQIGQGCQCGQAYEGKYERTADDPFHSKVSPNISQETEVSLARHEPGGPIPAGGGRGLVVASLLGTEKERTEVRN